MRLGANAHCTWQVEVIASSRPFDVQLVDVLRDEIALMPYPGKKASDS
jgi:hypothetical protein